MKNAIIQYYINPLLYNNPDFNKLLKHDVLADISAKTWKAYSEKYNCDYIRITKPKLKYKHPTYERFDLWLDKSWWDKYDQIMYVDSDVFAMPDAPNIFEQYNDLNTFKFCYYNKFREKSITNIKKEFKNMLLGTLDPVELQTKGFQPGVFILTKKSVEKMYDWIKLYQQFDSDDGQILLYSVIKSKVAITEMNGYYNYKNAYFRRRPKIYFFHAMGQKKDVWQNRIIKWLKEKKAY